VSKMCKVKIRERKWHCMKHCCGQFIGSSCTFQCYFYVVFDFKCCDLPQLDWWYYCKLAVTYLNSRLSTITEKRTPDDIDYEKLWSCPSTERFVKCHEKERLEHW